MRLYLPKVKVIKNKHQAASPTLDEVEQFWNKARIPMRPRHHSLKQLENLIARWKVEEK